jgi:EAL domain-containing protein (putative c-di-GMP-specific phosphodiesterase class I)
MVYGRQCLLLINRNQTAPSGRKRYGNRYSKIDGNFIKDIHQNPTNYAIIESIHKNAQLMGIQIIVAFVENNETHLTLQETGANYVQEYGISKPQPLEIDDINPSK